MHDFRHALRQLTKSPGFAATAILSLALGIGACTAIFSVVNSVLLRPLAYPDSGRLILLRETKLPQFPEFDVAPGNYFAWKEGATSFEQLAAVRHHGIAYNLTGVGEPVRVSAARITPNYLSTLRVHPLMGRNFSDDEGESSTKVVLLSHRLWVRHFGGRRDIVNRTVQLNGEAYEILGVLPESFDRGSRAELFTPAGYSEDNQNRGSHYLRVIGRLKPGVTLDQARSELTLLSERLVLQHPDTNTGWGVKLTPLLEAAVADVRPALYTLLGAVNFLLVITCANVANLQLARASVRAREISVRLALGASRARIIRQLLTESVLLAVLGGALGVLVAAWGVSALPLLAPDDLPRVEEISLDGHALLFTSAVALLTGILFGLAPALQASRVNLNETLKTGGRGLSHAPHRQRLRSGLVVVELAFALVLLVGSGLLVRSFTHLLAVDPGFDPRNTHAVTLSLPANKHKTDAQKAAFAEQATERFAALPGVQSAAATNMLPLSEENLIFVFNVVGRPEPRLESGDLQTATFYSVTPDYFRAMRIPLRRGRLFTSADTATAPGVALVNESLAKRYFPGEDPIGQHVELASGRCEIVGVVADVRHGGLDAEVRAQTYVPFAQVSFSSMTLVVRSSAEVALAPATIRGAIYDIDREQPVATIRPLSDLVAASVARSRFMMTLFALFSVLALLLAALGIYGVIAYSVAQRTAEIGIRVALGAQRSDVLRLVALHGGTLIALGLAGGLCAALLLTRFLSSMLFGVTAYDPTTFAAITLLLATVAALACLIPANRATRVDPLTALRAE